MEDNGRLTALEYNFYYYTSNGEFTINYKTFILYGLMICVTLIILSVDRLYLEKNYTGLTITSIVFLVLLLIIRRLQTQQ